MITRRQTARVRTAAIAVTAVLGLFASILAAPAAAEGEVGEFPSPEEFVIQQYLDFLQRSPDAGGLAFWADSLRAGVDPGALIEQLVLSPEFGQVVAPNVRLYYAYFDRSPDFNGLNFWSAKFREGTPLAAISEVFAGSEEFENTYGSLNDARFVDLVYRNVLGRAPDSEGRSFWISQLSSGMTRGEMMIGFSESAEFILRMDGVVRATMLYLGMLRRAPDDAGLEFWADSLDAGASYPAAINGFRVSTEYANRVRSLFPAIQPLTGERARSVNPRPAITAKIGNSQRGRPQIGINQADIVYEQLVEGRVSRFLAVYHSQTPVALGPMRSVRTGDFNLFDQFNTPLVAASGANSSVLGFLADHPVVDFSALRADGYYRTANRPAPYNLLVNPTVLWNSAPAQASTPTPMFQYRAPGSAPTEGVPSAGFDVSWGNTIVNHRWNGVGYDRTQNGSAHVDSIGVRVSPPNVILHQATYSVSLADAESPHSDILGEGVAWVFTGGVVIQANWTKASPTAPAVYTSAETGKPVLLTPGRTWVLIAPPGSFGLAN